MSQINREYQHKESLIQQAKAEYVKRTMPADKKTQGGTSKWRCTGAYELADGRPHAVITDPNDAKFDLEAYLTMAMADGAK